MLQPYTRNVVSDEEIERVHAYANFGDMPKRDVVDEGVLKVALGYGMGHTMQQIIAEHGLIWTPRGNRKLHLSKKGEKYLRSMFREGGTKAIMGARDV